MKLSHAMLTVFGLGLLKPASGTWGSTPPPLLAFALITIGVPLWQVNVSIVLMAVLFSLVCVRFGEAAESTWGKKDPGQVVADEVAGQSLVLLLIPWHEPTAFILNAVLCVAAFLLFRFFDILKPPPARRLQRLQFGWGILIDDLIAGLYAAIIMQALVRGLPALLN